MECSAADVAALVARELAAIADVAVREGLRSRLTYPTADPRDWDYGSAGEQYPCWIVAAQVGIDTAIVYSEHGFGPSDPWGIVSTSSTWFGMDSAWFLRLEDAFVQSSLARDLPIWDVVAETDTPAARVLASSLLFDEAFSRRDELAGQNPQLRCHVRYRSQPAEGIP